MAQINLKIKSDFSQASKDLQKFGAVTESQRKQIEKYQKSFKTEKVDSFIDANRRLGAGIKANKGDISAIITQQKALERQSISLIKKGLDPQSKEVQKLSDEYNRLQKEYEKTTLATKGMEDATKIASKALAGIGVVVVATATAIVASTVELGSMGDELAKTSKKIDVGTDTLQELGFAAERVGLPANSLSGLFTKLNRNMGDLQAGTGTLTTFLNKSDTALKAQLESTTDSEEAFNILVDAIAKAPTQFDKAALSQAAFGRSGQDLILFANEGSEEINKLREEARNYGIISEKVAKQGEEFVDSQRNLQQATIGVRAEMAEKLLPAMTKTLNKIAGFISDGDKFKKTLETVGIALAGVTAGLTTFLILSKGASAIAALQKAFLALNLAMKANPAIFIASIITAVLIPAIILIVKNWDKVSEVISTSLEVLSNRFKMLGVNIKTGWTVAINALKIAWLSLGSIIVDKVLGGVQKFLDLASKIPFVGKHFATLSDTVGDTRQAFSDLTDEAINNSKQVIDSAIAERNEINQTTNENIENIKNESKERLNALKVLEDQNSETTETIIDNNQAVLEDSQTVTAELTEEEQKLLDKRLELNQKWTDDLLKQSGDKLAILEAEKADAIENAESVGADTTLVHKFYENEKAKITKELADKKKADRAKDFQEEIDQYKTLTSTIGGIAENLFATQNNFTEREKNKKIKALDDKALSEEEYADAVVAIEREAAIKLWEDEKKALIAKKAFATAEIVFNTAIGVSKAWAQGGIFGAVGAGLVLGAGIAAGAAVLSEPEPEKPTFQTGTPMGGFEVPQNTGSSKADNTNIAVSPNENVTVTPRGEGGQGQNIIVQIDKQTIFDIVTEGNESGDIRITADNIQTA